MKQSATGDKAFLRLFLPTSPSAAAGVAARRWPANRTSMRAATVFVSAELEAIAELGAWDWEMASC
jgi:hypothetical protein